MAIAADLDKPAGRRGHASAAAELACLAERRPVIAGLEPDPSAEELSEYSGGYSQILDSQGEFPEDAAELGATPFLGRGRPVLMMDLLVHRFPCLDGVELAWREVGSGRPFVLLHGLMGSGALLADQGLVPALAERGYRVILPDMRGHGDSGRPHDPACYPPDILADDTLALIGHLGLDDYDLGGYSMGGKLVLRLLARGAGPAHAVVGGQGLDALDAESDRTNGHRRILAAAADGAALPAGSPEEAMADWIRQSGVDARAVGLVLGTFVATPADALRPVSAPTLVVVGDRDSRSTSADSLAALLPHGQLVLVPGDHFTALGAPEFTAAVLEFLGKSLPANASRFPETTSAYRPV